MKSAGGNNVTFEDLAKVATDTFPDLGASNAKPGSGATSDSLILGNTIK